MIVGVITLLMMQLQSFSRAMLVFLTGPMGIAGVAMALLVLNRPFGFVALLGVIALMGMIQRNSVILIDQIEQDRARGVPDSHIFVLGHSAGGWSSLMAARKDASGFNAVVAFAPGGLIDTFARTLQPQLATLAGVQASRCVYVGDDLRDIEAGRAAGMPTIAASYGYCGNGPPPSEWRADALIANAAELIPLLLASQRA